jgi:putative PEP-CTERM system TPR-repeat lipoprotein
VLKRVPEHVPSLVLLAAVELQERQLNLAEGHLQKALSLAPRHVGARALLARSQLASRQPGRAVETLRPLMETAALADPTLMMLAGEAYLANGDLKQAAGLFEAAAQVKAQQPLARTRLGQIALLSGDLEGGVRELESVTAAEGAPMQADLALLAAYVRQGQTAKALEVAQTLAKKRPDDPMVHQTLGSVLLLQKENAAARAAFSKATELNPTYMPSVASLAQLDLAEGKPADARARLEAVLAKEPANELALLGLAEVLARGRAPAAEVIAVLKRAVAAAPQSVTARVALINRYLQERDGREALAVAQEAPGGAEQDPRLLDALGRAQMATGDTNQAIETFNRAAVAEPKSVTPLLRLASVHASRKEYEKAAEVLLRAQKIAPADSTVGRDLVIVYLAMGKGDEALKQARALQASAPSSPAGFGLEGDIHSTTKQWAAAEKAYRAGLKADPTSVALAVKLHATLVAANRKAEADSLGLHWIADHPSDPVFRSYLGEQALRTRDLKVAVAQYEAVIALQPDNVVALNNVAWALGQLGDPKALGYAERALKLAPDSPAVLDTIGVLLMSRGEAVKGSEHLARAVTLAPDRHDIRLNYAKALLKAGRAEEARKELVRLQAVGQDFAGKSEVAGLLKQ